MVTSQLPDNAPSPASGRHLRYAFLIAFGFWLLVAAITMGNTALTYNMVAQSEGCPSWFLTGLSNIPYFIFWALLTPLLWHFLSRRPRGGPARKLVFFTSLGLMTALASMIVKVVSRELVIHRGWPDHALGTHMLLFEGLHVELLVFAGTCMALLAWEAHRKLRLRQLREAELAGSLARARLQSLSMQIHPHFLFNALNTISALVVRDPTATRRVVARLSEMLRTSLEVGEEPMISMTDALAFLRQYLEVEQVRYGPRLEVVWAIEPETADASIPPFLIQPLVENAIRHGIAGLTDGGTVRIAVARCKDNLEIRVRDNGPGCPLEDGRPPLGIGLGNISERLEQLFGTRARLSFSLPETDGFEACIVLPFLEHAEEAGLAEALPN